MTRQHGHDTGAVPALRGHGRPVTSAGLTGLFSPVCDPNPATKGLVAPRQRAIRVVAEVSA